MCTKLRYDELKKKGRDENGRKESIKTKAFFEQNGQIQDIVPNTVLLYKKS